MLGSPSQAVLPQQATQLDPEQLGVQADFTTPADADRWVFPLEGNIEDTEFS